LTQKIIPKSQGNAELANSPRKEAIVGTAHSSNRFFPPLICPPFSNHPYKGAIKDDPKRARFNAEV